jgi:hypothetical protein
MRVFLNAIDSLAPADASAIRSAIRPEYLDPISRGTSAEWVPATWNVDWVHAVSRHLDPDRFARFFRAMTRRDFETSVYKNFVAGAIRLFGANVGILIKRVPAGFSLMWRDAGDVEVHGLRGAQCELTMSRVAPELVDAHWLDSFRFGVSGIFDVLEKSATVIVRDIDADARSVTFALSWSH